MQSTAARRSGRFNKMHGALRALHVSLNNISTRTVRKCLKRDNGRLMTSKFESFSKFYTTPGNVFPDQDHMSPCHWRWRMIWWIADHQKHYEMGWCLQMWNCLWFIFVEISGWASGVCDHFVAVAEYDFDAQSHDELSFKQGTVLNVAPKGLMIANNVWLWTTLQHCTRRAKK